MNEEVWVRPRISGGKGAEMEARSSPEAEGKEESFSSCFFFLWQTLTPL